MKVLFDTCVVVDLLGKTQFFKEAFVAYDVALFKKMDVCLSVSSTTDIVYLLHSRGFADREKARRAAAALFDQFDILDNTASDMRLAAESEMSDYEDALIAYSALRNDIDFIITRNVKDFVFSPVPALMPSAFVDLHKPSCLGYEEIEF